MLLPIVLGLVIFLFNNQVVFAQNAELTSPIPQNIDIQDSPSKTPAPAAIQPVNLTLSPISINLIADPGSTLSSAIKIRNNGSSPEYLRLRLATFSASPTGDAPVISDFDPEDEYQGWLAFPEPSFKVAPGEWKTIPLTFSPPSTAALGYYYAILVERQQEAAVEEGQSLVAGVPAILVLTEVNSPLAKRQLELVSFTANRKLYEYLPAEFTVTIKNTGNIQAMPMGDLFIDGQRSNDIAAIQLNPAKGMILPNSQRSFTVFWDDGFPRYQKLENADTKQTSKLMWEFSRADKFRIGKYSATALFVYDDGMRDVPTQATLDFWIIPWRLILLILGLIVLDIFRSRIINFIKLNIFRKKTKE